MRVLVTGGRKFRDRDAVFAALDGIHASGAIQVLIEGGASGADYLAGSWAGVRGVSHWRVPANWKDGPAAGHIRNARMLAMCAPDLVIAFPGGAGTLDMVDQAKAAGVKVRDGLEAQPDPNQTDIFGVLEQ